MKFFIRSVIISFLFINTQLLFAEQSKLFRGCYEFPDSFKNESVNLKSNSPHEKQTAYFIHNKSNARVTLLLVKSGKTSYLSYKNQINAQEWGVFAMDELLMSFSCHLPGQKAPVNCHDYLKVCQYENIKFPQSNNGNYWPVSSLPLNQARKEMRKLGILLRW